MTTLGSLAQARLTCRVKRWQDYGVTVVQHAHFHYSRTTPHHGWQSYAGNPRYILKVCFFALSLSLPTDQDMSACAPVPMVTANCDRFDRASTISAKGLDFGSE